MSKDMRIEEMLNFLREYSKLDENLRRQIKMTIKWKGAEPLVEIALHVSERQTEILDLLFVKNGALHAVGKSNDFKKLLYTRNGEDIQTYFT